MTAAEVIMTYLTASGDLADLISLWTKDATEYKMIFNGLYVPAVSADNYKKTAADDSETSLIKDGLLSPDVTFNTVNFYRETSIDGFLPHKEADYSINCRAYTQRGSEAIATAVYNALNKKSGEGYTALCFLEPTIPPADKSDNFNTRVTARLKTTE